MEKSLLQTLMSKDAYNFLNSCYVEELESSSINQGLYTSTQKELLRVHVQLNNDIDVLKFFVRENNKEKNYFMKIDTIDIDFWEYLVKHHPYEIEQCYDSMPNEIKLLLKLRE